MSTDKTLYKYTVQYKFSGNMDDLEDWLVRHCSGKFKYELTDIHETDTPFGQLDILLHFQHSEDREKFKVAALEPKDYW